MDTQRPMNDNEQPLNHTQQSMKEIEASFLSYTPLNPLSPNASTPALRGDFNLMRQPVPENAVGVGAEDGAEEHDDEDAIAAADEGVDGAGACAGERPAQSEDGPAEYLPFVKWFTGVVNGFTTQ